MARILLLLALLALPLLGGCSKRQDSRAEPVRRSAETGKVLEEDMRDVARREREQDRFREQVHADLYQGRDSRY